MKTTSLLLLTFAFAAPLAAEDNARPLAEAAMKRFDKDGDGKLNETERAAAREEFKARAGERLEAFLNAPGPRVLEKFDADKDGKLNDSEKSAAREALKALAGEALRKLKDKADANNDGTVDDAERAKVREHLKNHPQGPLRRRLLHLFDEDKDGKLSEAERAKAKAAWEARQAGGQ